MGSCSRTSSPLLDGWERQVVILPNNGMTKVGDVAAALGITAPALGVCACPLSGRRRAETAPRTVTAWPNVIGRVSGIWSRPISPFWARRPFVNIRPPSKHVPIRYPRSMATRPVMPEGTRARWAQVIRHAQCARDAADPDVWFPVSTAPAGVRREAAEAVAICRTCPVRDRCLELSLRHWDIGRHGIWGGLLPAERADIRRLLLIEQAGSPEPLGESA